MHIVPFTNAHFFNGRTLPIMTDSLSLTIQGRAARKSQRQQTTTTPRRVAHPFREGQPELRQTIALAFQSACLLQDYHNWNSLRRETPGCRMGTGGVASLRGETSNLDRLHERGPWGKILPIWRQEFLIWPCQIGLFVSADLFEFWLEVYCTMRL